MSLAAERLFDHWQRNVSYSAKMTWADCPARLKATFEGQAEAAYPITQSVRDLEEWVHVRGSGETDVALAALNTLKALQDRIDRAIVALEEPLDPEKYLDNPWGRSLHKANTAHEALGILKP